jgi:vacuolar-type H+-ATPase subunit E/Vma4
VSEENQYIEERSRRNRQQNQAEMNRRTLEVVELEKQRASSRIVPLQTYAFWAMGVIVLMLGLYFAMR